MRRAGVIINPTKVDDADKLRARIREVMAGAGWDEPQFRDTTAEDPGCAMTREALADGVELVIAAGGDGTVRACADVLAGSQVPLAVLPLGTGNLLARNLGIPIEPDAALEVVLSGRDRAIDLGCAGSDRFAVMVGMGFEAAMLAGASERAKRTLGWGAYVASGLRRLRGPRFRVRITPVDGPEQVRRARSVMVANLGTLQGGLELLPEAVPDDGQLDVAVLVPRGLADWIALAWHVLRRREHDHSRGIVRFRVRGVRISTASAQPYELDGDPVGDTRELDVTVTPGALRVRVPAEPRGEEDATG